MVTLDQAGAGIPGLSLAAAPRTLRSRVECFWTERPVEARHPACGSWRVVPDGSSHVLYHRISIGSGSEIRHRLVIVGPRTHAIDVDKSRRALTVGARLRPWAAASLLGVPAGELVDGSWTLESVVGSEAAALAQRLRESGAEEARTALAQWLLRRAARAETTEERRAREAATRLERWGRCDRAASGVGVGSRRLRTVMREQVGLSPKILARVARLHGALRRMGARGPGASWPRIAVSSGYYDQSHMIREFRRLLGETPGGWRARGA